MALTFIGSSTSWIDSLADAGVMADVKTAAADGVFSLADFLKILQDVAASGPVTAAQFASLQALAANLENGVQTSDYLASVFTQLVNGSPANATWTGGATTSVALGNLAVGATAGQLGQLIGKWFLGTDLPSAGDGTALTYKTFAVPLFGPTGLPQLSDIAQGQVGDCEFLAALAEVVQIHPDYVKSMIVDNGNGTYGVRFYIGGNETWVTVNRQLPGYGSAGLVYDGVYNAPDLWSALVEKAYAQLSSTGLIGHPAINAYSNISGDPPRHVFANLSDATQALYFDYTDANWSNDQLVALEALASGNDVTVECGISTYDATGKQILVGSHAYALLGYDAVTGKFSLFNPWGVLVTVSLADIAAAHGDFVVSNSARGSVSVIGAGVQGYSQNVLVGTPVALASLFVATDTTGKPIKQYKFEVAGTSTINLNGAANLATPSQATLGQIVVAAADLGKLTYSGSAAGVTNTLMIWASDGATWSPVSDFALTPTTSPTQVVARPGAWLAAGSTVALSSLFSVIGATSISGSYQIWPASGATINLNGAKLWGGSVATGHYDFYASELSKITVTAMAGAATASFYAWYYNGSSWSSQQTISFAIESVATAAAAIVDYDTGQFTAAGVITDSAANIFANLDALQTIVAGGTVVQMNTTDATNVVETLQAAQFFRDTGALAELQGLYSLNVAGATVAQALGLDTSIKNPIAFQIGDTAADVAAALDALNVASNVTSIALTDGASHALTLTQAQATADAVALGKLVQSYTLDITGVAGKTWTEEMWAHDSGGRLAGVVYKLGSGAAYEQISYDPSTGRQTQKVWYAADGVSDAVEQDFNVDGSYVAAHFGLSNPNYTQDRVAYNAAGRATSVDHLRADGSIYKHMVMDPVSGRALQAQFDAVDGSVLVQQDFNADGSYFAQYFGLVSPNFTHQRVTYNTAGQFTFVDYLRADGSIYEHIIMDPVAGRKTEAQFDAPDGSVIVQQDFNIDGSYYAQYFGLVSPNYTHQRVTYNAAILVSAIDYLRADNSIYEHIVLDPATGRQTQIQYDSAGGALVAQQDFNLDGSYTSRQFGLTNPNYVQECTTINAAGKTVSVDYLRGDGSTFEHVAYDAASGRATQKLFNTASGALAVAQDFFADGGWATTTYGLAGAYASQTIDYASGGAAALLIDNMNDGSRVYIASANGLNLSGQGVGASANANDVFNLAGYSGEALTLHANFGVDVVNGFSTPSGDTITFDNAIFAGSLALLTSGASASGHDLRISDGGGDMLTLTNVLSTGQGAADYLSANKAAFHVA